MGDNSFEEEEFCLPADLLTDELILMNKENLFKDRRSSPLPPPRTPVLTHPPSDSLSYYSNDFLVPPFSSGPKFPQPWEMTGPTQPILGPVLGPSLLPLPAPAPAPPRPVAAIGTNINYQMNINGQGQPCNFTPVQSLNTLPGTHTGTMWGHQQAGGHFGNGGYDVTPGLAWGDLQGSSCGSVEMRAVGYGGGMRTERAGTGVFLPRRYYNTPPQPRRRSGGSAQPPPRLIKAQNKKFANVTPQFQAQNKKFANVTPQFQTQNKNFANVTPQLQAPRQMQPPNRKFANVTPQLQAPHQTQAPNRKFANVSPQLEAPRQMPTQNRKFVNVTPQLEAPRQVPAQDKKFANVTPQLQAPRQMPTQNRKFANVTPQLETPRQVPVQDKKFANVTPQLQAPRQVQAQDKKFANVTPQLQLKGPRQFASGSHISENELVMARKNAALGQEWRKYEPPMTSNTTDATTASAEEGMRVNNEISLPQEWTYTYELFKRTSLDEN